MKIRCSSATFSLHKLDRWQRPLRHWIADATFQTINLTFYSIIMNKKFYPLIIFGLIGAYHAGTYFVGYGYEEKRRDTIKMAETERQQRMKGI